MKIAFIGQKGIPAKIGGGERYVEEVAVELAKRGHEAFAYVRNNYTEKDLLSYKGVRLIHLPSIPTKHLDAISHTFLATVHVLFSDFDVVHYNMIGPTSLCFILKILKRKTAVISTFQCQDYTHKKWGLFARAYLKMSEYMTCKVPDATVIVSRSLLEYSRRKYGSTSLFYIPNGAQIKSNKNFDELEEWGLSPNKYILSVSRFIRHKGIHYLIEAFKSLEDKGLTGGAKLAIVGDGFHTDDYVHEIKELAAGHKNIIFTGAQTGETLDQLFSNCSFFVQPSESEGLSLALLEAMGYGKAVLASNIVENMEPLGDTGLFFENKNVYDLEAKILTLLGNTELTDKFGDLAKTRIINEYGWPSIVGQMENIYKTIISRKNHGKNIAI